MKKIIITLIVPVLLLSGCYSRLEGGAPVRGPHGQPQPIPAPPISDGIPIDDAQVPPPAPAPYVPGASDISFPSHAGIEMNQDPVSAGTQTAGMIPPTSNQQPQQSTPIRALLDEANKAVAANQLDRAASALDRAVRLEPKNASIWYDLAQIRLHQGKYSQAEQLARRSISFAGSNSDLTKKNWKVIGSVKKAQGDNAGANEAFRNAQ